ncbi:hypothetical protein DO72_3817 [Burkholderia pseudomallei]|nr:hypothetical protein DO72_3817 [Burkholderia pseudomallei]
MGRDGPVDPVDRVIRVWPCALRRRASLVTRHSSLVGCCSSLFVVVGPTSAGPIGPNELLRSLRDTPRPFPHFLLASLWTSCASSDQPFDVQAFSRRCHECVNRRPHAYRTRRTAPNAPIDSRDGSGRARRTTPTALGDHDRFPQFLLASLWTSWVRSAQTVDPSRFCRIGRINGSRCRSMPRVPARRAFGRTPLAGLRASAHRIAAALVHIFCGQACGHPTHPPHNPLIRRHFSRHARKEATRPPRTNRRAPPRPRP